jgi:hypothetical protein
MKKKNGAFFLVGYILYLRAKPNKEKFPALLDGSGVFI